MQILILCGGIGSRLKPLIKGLPKGMAPVANQPFMNLILERLVRNNLCEVILCTGFGHEEYLREYGNKFETLKIKYSKDPEGEPLGTGGAVLNAINLLEDNFFVQYGDTLLEIDYLDAFDAHLKSKKAMTMTALHKDLTKEKPNIFISSDRSIVRYNKQPIFNKDEYQYIDYGLLIFNKKSFLEYANFFSSNNKFDLGLLQTKISEKEDTNIYFCNKPYFEIGTPSSYKSTKKKFEDTNCV